MSAFNVPFVCKGPACQSSDGFEICVQAIVVLDEQGISIFERCNDGDANPILNMPFNDLDGIKCRKFRSNGGSYYGGRVELVGAMDNEWKERVVLKMEIDEFNRFQSALKSMQQDVVPNE